MGSIKLKLVNSESADIIVNIHFDAVHKGHALHFYDMDILNEWSPPVSEERINEFGSRISSTQSVVILAYFDEKPVGFGILDIKLKRIGAIYVKAAYTGFQIGTVLLKELELKAIQNGYEELYIESSLNAKTFYEKNGYAMIAESYFSLPSGKQMESVSMKKILRNS